MRILVTNDDGINATGIEILVNKAKKYGEVTVVAPFSEQSAKSHAINVRDSFAFGISDKFEGIKAYYVDSTPADCIRYAYYGLKLEFDIVFSGVNKGFNVGQDILYSGTVAAIFESANLGKPGIAFSADRHSFDCVERHFDEVMDYIFGHRLLEYGSLYNVNFPMVCNKIVITKQGGCSFDTFFENDGKNTIQLGMFIAEKNPDNCNLDTFAASHGLISITPLTNQRTDIFVYDKIKHINDK